MKILGVILLSFITLLQSFSKWIIVADYEFNKEYISKNLCINKERPKLHCNGKCQLMKKLAEEEKQNSSNSNNPGKVKFQDIVFIESYKAFSPTLCLLPEQTYSDHHSIAEYQSPVASIFHPPALS